MSIDGGGAGAGAAGAAGGAARGARATEPSFHWIHSNRIGKSTMVQEGPN